MNNNLIWATFLAILVVSIATTVTITTLNWSEKNNEQKIACIEQGGLYSLRGECTWSRP